MSQWPDLLGFDRITACFVALLVDVMCIIKLALYNLLINKTIEPVPCCHISITLSVVLDSSPNNPSQGLVRLQ